MTRKTMVLILVVLGALALKSSAAAQSTFGLGGTITDQFGNPVSDVTVWIVDPETGGSQTTQADSNGIYGAEVQAGIYDIIIASIQGCSTTRVSITANTVLDIVLTPEPTLSGVSRDRDGVPVDGQVVGFQENGTDEGVNWTAGDGSFSIAACPGTYSLAIRPGDDPRNHPKMPSDYELSSDFRIDLNTDQIQDLTFPTVILTVTVQDSQGNPIPNANVRTEFATSLELFPGGLFHGNGNHAENTDAAGVAQLPLFPPSSPITVTVYPDYFAPTSVSLPSVPVDTSITITLPQPPVSFSGVLRDSDGIPLPRQVVTLSISGCNGYVDSRDTAGDGSFSFTVTPGTYTLLGGGEFEHATDRIPERYNYCSDFSLNLNTDLVLDLTLPTVFLTVHVQDPLGNPVPNAIITSEGYATRFELIPWGFAHGSADAFGQTDALGTAQVILLPSVSPVDFLVTPPLESGLSEAVIPQLTIVDDMEQTVVLLPIADSDGVSDEVEDNAPNGGDGNSDGIPDGQQGNVTSLPNSADGQYVTLVSPQGTGFADVQAAGNPSPGDAPAGVDFPTGFFDYRLQGLTPGASMTITLLLPSGVTVETYYKYGPTPDNLSNHWYEFLFDGTTGAEINGSQVILHFVDGLRGDDDLTTNGAIVEPGAPAISANQLPAVASNNVTVTVGEGQIAVNSGTVSDPDGDPVSLTAPVGAVVNNGNGTWSWTFVTSDGPFESQTVTIGANDGKGGTSQVTFDLVVNNVAPTASFANITGIVNMGGTVTLAFSSQYDPSGLDTTAGFLYSYDCTSAGTFEATVSDASYGCVYPTAGTFTARGHIADQDAGFTPYTATVIVNAPPVANPDSAIADEDMPVIINVLENDNDADGDPLTVTDVSSASNGAVVNNSDGAVTYTPNPNVNGSDSFTYTIADGGGGSASAVVTVTIRLVNDLPVVGVNSGTVTVNEGQVATNSGTVSDVDGDWLTLSASAGTAANNGDGTWSWSFATTDGPAQSQTVTIFADDSHGGANQTAFSLTVNNAAPTVNAGADQTVYRNDLVNVTGTWTDPAGASDNIYTWSWDLNGDSLPDSGGSAPYGTSIPATTSFTADGVFNLVFQVADKDSQSGSDTLVVTVMNRPPNCSTAGPDVAIVWPPNHQFVTINVLGVSDPEGDPISVTLTSIFQDEPVNGTGEGDTAPDGQGVGSAAAAVRAERAGSGNGRVYHIGFTATDGHGGTCSGEVRVGVPKSQGEKGDAVDDGALYDSTMAY